MDASLLESLSDPGHRYPIPNDASVSGMIDRLVQDMKQEYYIT